MIYCFLLLLCVKASYAVQSGKDEIEKPLAIPHSHTDSQPNSTKFDLTPFAALTPPEENAVRGALEESITEDKIKKTLQQRLMILKTRKELANKGFHITPLGHLVFHNWL